MCVRSIELHSVALRSSASSSVTGPLTRSRREPHRRDDVLVARAAAEVAGERLADLALVEVAGSSRSMRLERHQESGRAEAALQAVGLVEGLLERVQLAVGPARPSTVRIACPSACTARIRHERTGSPSSWTVQAPQTPCSHPTWVPVRPASWRMKSESSSRGSISRSYGPAVDLYRRLSGWSCRSPLVSEVDHALWRQGKLLASAPRASETALAITAPAAAVPPSPAPLTPSGLSGVGASSVTDPHSGHLAGGRQQVVHERAGDQLAAGVVGELLEQGAAEPLGQAADDLAVDERGLMPGPRRRSIA